MKYYELDKEEKKIIDSVENGEWQSIEDLASVKATITTAAKLTLNKTRNINIRLSEKDLQKLKAKAVREGIPYQTLASSILHQSAIK